MKRLVDVVFAALAIVGLAPLLIVIAVWVKIDSPGPVIFRQQRVGRNGETFDIYKFRSMTQDKKTEIGSFEAGDISRVTKAGKFIRKYKLDELPQFFNVLKGDMSIVGPRPEVEKWVMAYPERWATVLHVRPGITDPASLAFRDEESVLAEFDDPEHAYKEIVLPRKLDFYEDYIRDQSFIGDAFIMIKTVFRVIGG